MKHYNYLVLLPIAMLFAIVVSSCSGLTDEEKAFVGTWSCETSSEDTLDEGMRLIYTAYDYVNYHDDKTYDDNMDASIKLEWNFDDGSIRMYWYYKSSSKNSWLAGNGTYSDSIINYYNVRNIVAPSNTIAIKMKGSDNIIRFGIDNIPNSINPTLAEAIKELYNEETKNFNEILNGHNKSVYKIVSLSDKQIVCEDNNGEKMILNKGKVMSDRIQQMMAEGEALR